MYFFSTDIDECSIENDCHVNATCNNTVGSYECHCVDGFSGNGTTCESKTHFWLNIAHHTKKFNRVFHNVNGPSTFISVDMPNNNYSDVLVWMILSIMFRSNDYWKS